MLNELNQRLPKRAYSYDCVTGEFLAVVYADPDPLDVDNWLLPANSTFVVLDEAPKGYVAIFVNGAKELKIDNRGKVFYTPEGVKKTIINFGEEIPEEALLEMPVLPPTFEEQVAAAEKQCSDRIARKWNRIGQVNAALGVYSEEDRLDCANWIASHREALATLLENEDLISIDVSEDSNWP